MFRSESRKSGGLSTALVANQLRGAPELPRLLGSSVFERYRLARRASRGLPVMPDADLAAVQGSVRRWIEQQDFGFGSQDYAAFDRARIERKIGGLVDYLAANFADIPAVDLEATIRHTEMAFELYEQRTGDHSPHPDGDGSFAFIVPPRMSRLLTEYGQEVEPAIPGMRYVPNELRADMIVGLPPSVIDVYETGVDDVRGYLVFTPIYADMMIDLDPVAGLAVAQRNINAAVDFAQERLGVSSVGLGAVLPALTRFGQLVDNPNVTVTTGHAGTIALISKLLDDVETQQLLCADAPLGVLGLGSIGASIARVLAGRYPGREMIIYDNEDRKISRTVERFRWDGHLPKVATDVGDLLKRSGAVVSAITGTIDLGTLGTDIDLGGTLIIDDSQPASFDPMQVAAHGGTAIWVIGRHVDRRIQRETYDYGTMLDPSADLFGCEGEAVALAMLDHDLKMGRSPDAPGRENLDLLAQRRPVDPDRAHSMAMLFDYYGIGPAPHQAFGRPVTIANGHSPRIPKGL